MSLTKRDFIKMTREELLEIETDLIKKMEAPEFDAYETDQKYPINYYPQLISLYEVMHDRAKTNYDSDPQRYQGELENCKRDLIEFLIKNGGYLKTIYQKDNRTAEHNLRKALRINKDLPIAHYRLGFLDYKNQKYSQAVSRFQKAIKCNKSEHYINQDYKLTNQHIYFAYRYIKNSYLHLAVQAESEEEYYRPNVKKHDIKGYDNTHLAPLLNKDTAQIADQAYMKTTIQEEPAEPQYCSLEECWKAYENRDGKTIFLIFGDEEILLGYDKYGPRELLTFNRAKQLRHLLLKTSAETPVTRLDMTDLFDTPRTGDEVNPDTFRQAIRRIRKALTHVGAPDIIRSKNTPNGTAYYFNHSCPIVIVHRSDADFIALEKDDIDDVDDDIMD